MDSEEPSKQQLNEGDVLSSKGGRWDFVRIGLLLEFNRIEGPLKCSARIRVGSIVKGILLETSFSSIIREWTSIQLYIRLLSSFQTLP
jgi:hypothetical protein